ncbi:MAG: (d)CMP kinase [Planctomycetota bacterium]
MSPLNEPHADAPTDVVAIDGPSGAGKSTIARRLAERLGFGFLDTGAMYRAITRHFLDRGVALDAAGPDAAAESRCGGGRAGESEASADPVRAALADASLRLQAGRVLLNGEDVTQRLRTRDVEARVSAVAAMPCVRARMGDLQRAVARQGPVVAEGRDMCSVVFPRARWKIYLDAAPAERARRRCEDFRRRGRAVVEEQVLAEILERDRLDSTRADAPLQRAADALYVDSTGVDADAVLDRLLGYVRSEGGAAE